MHPFVRALIVFTGAAGVAVLSVAAPTIADKTPEAPDQLVRVQNVEVMPSPIGPVIVLRIAKKAIPVFVEPVVAHSIQLALAGQEPARPMTHDLMKTILDSLDAKVTQVVITLKDGTYYGALTVTVNGKPKVFDSRSSDAIALAIRYKVPILLDPALVKEAGVEQTESTTTPI